MLAIEKRSAKRLLQGVNDVLGDIQLVHGEFVKTSMIRQVVVDLILPFKQQYDQLVVEQNNFKLQQKDHAKAISNAANDGKKALHDLQQLPDIHKHINQVEKQVMQLDKHCRFKFDEVHGRFTEVLHKFKLQDQEFRTFKKQITETNERFKTLHKTIDNVRDKLNKEMKQFETSIQQRMSSTKENVDQFTHKIRQFENLFHDLSQSVDQSVQRAVIKIETHHRQEMEKFIPCLKAIEKTNQLTNLIKNWEPKIEQLMGHLHSSENVNIFIERHLPFLQHFQLCEAIREITGKTFHDNLRAFEINKLNQLFVYDNKCKGHQTNVEGLSARIDLYAHHFKREGKGIAPFIMGRDYAPYMDIEDNMFLDKACLIQFELYNLQVQNDRKVMHQIKRLCERIAEQTPEEERSIIEFLKQLKPYQIPQLHQWIYEQRLNIGDYDSMILDYSGHDIENGKEDKPKETEKNLQKYSSQNSEMFEKDAVQARSSTIVSKSNSRGTTTPNSRGGSIRQTAAPKTLNQIIQGNQNIQTGGGQAANASPSGKQIMSNLTMKMGAKVQTAIMQNMLKTTKMHSEQAQLAFEGINKTQSMMENQRNSQHLCNKNNKQTQQKSRGRRGGQHNCDYDADQVKEMIDKGIETAVDEFKKSAKINNFPKQMYLVHTVPQQRMIQHKIRSKKHINQQTNKELKSIRKALYDFENLLPQSVIEYTQSQKKGIEVDFGKVADEIDEEEDQKLLEGIYDRIRQKNDNTQFDGRDKVDKEGNLIFHRMKRDCNEQYKTDVINSYRRKFKSGAMKIKEALSVPQKKEIKRKALLEARPNIPANDGTEEIVYEMGFTRDQARYIQNMIDKSIDWLRLFVKMNVETKTDDAKIMQELKFEDLKKYTQENVVQLYEQQQKSLNKVLEIHHSCNNLIKDLEEVQAQNKEERAQLHQFKQRLMNDVKFNNEKCNLKMDTFQKSLNKLVGCSNRNHEVLQQIIEVNMIESLVQAQDYQDKKQLNLLGMQTNKKIMSGEPPREDDDKKTYYLQKDQLMHEGSYAANSTLKQIKMACLSYQQTPIDYKGIKLVGEELLKMKDTLLVECQDIFQKIPINEYITDQMLAVNPTEAEQPKMPIASVNVSMSTFDNAGDKLDSRINMHNKSTEQFGTSKTLKPGLKHKSQAKVGLDDSKNQFNIKTIFKNQNLKNNQSVRQARYISQKKNSATVNYKTDPSNPVLEKYQRFNIKSEHLRARSNVRNQMNFISKQDIVQQFVDNDLESFQKNYVAYEGQSNSVQGVADKKTKLVRHPTPDLKRISTERDKNQTNNTSEKTLENDKLTYAQIAVQYNLKDRAGTSMAFERSHKKTVDFNSLKQMHDQIDSSQNMTIRAQKISPAQYPHQSYVNCLKSQGVLKNESLMMKRSKTPTANNMQRMFLIKQQENFQLRAGKDLMEVVSQGVGTQQTTKQGSVQVRTSLINSSQQTPSALEGFSSSIMTGFVQGPLDLKQNGTTQKPIVESKYRSQMETYDAQKSHISDDPNSILSEPKSPLPTGIQIQVAKQLSAKQMDESDMAVYSNVRQVRQNYVQASQKLFPQKIAKGPALKTVGQSTIQNKEDLQLIVKEKE